MVDYYRGNGSLSDLYEYYIWYYGDSSSYDAADERFNKVIRPYLKDFSLGQLVSIIKNSNENCQIYGRRKSYSANTEIATELSRKSNGQFDFSAYEHFNFDQSML